MRSLDEVRKEITENDREIARLFEKRMNLSKEVADYKRANNMNVFDSSREQAVIENFSDVIENKLFEPAAVRLICELMNISKQYQRTITNDTPSSFKAKCNGRVVCQGTVGAYGEEAASCYFGPDAKIECLAQFGDVFSAVASGEAEYGIVPIENSSTGAIGDVYDLFAEYDCHIAGEYILKINHNLLACEGASISTITDVYSHSQGFEQCTNFLKKYPTLNLVPYHNTAVSAKFVSESGDITKAAIASKRAAEIYNMKILAENINNNYNNYTRFVVITKNAYSTDGADKVSVMLRLIHKQGSLCGLMQHFADFGVNLLKIESRPIPNKSWEYNFFIDFAANLHDENMDKLIEKLKESSVSLSLLGNYKAV